MRVYSMAATMDQQHDATPLSLAQPPAKASIFIPNASTGNAYFDCPLATFTSVRMASLNTAYTN